eukprot:jgi/Botrbrau1/23052/Bobra.0614s0001.1
MYRFSNKGTIPVQDIMGSRYAKAMSMRTLNGQISLHARITIDTKTLCSLKFKLMSLTMPLTSTRMPQPIHDIVVSPAIGCLPIKLSTGLSFKQQLKQHNGISLASSANGFLSDLVVEPGMPAAVLGCRGHLCQISTSICGSSTSRSMKSGPALIERCSEHWFTATLDHFSWAEPDGGIWNISAKILPV